MRLRGVLALAILAALLGAPLTASAAGNQLHSPAASPTTGTVATLFRLQVSYSGSFPATLVEVSVAGSMLAMARVTGSDTNGSWATTTSLPVGSWPVSFRAVAAHGNQPTTLAGPTLAVASTPGADRPTSASPAPGAGPEPGLDDVGELDRGTPTPAPAPAASQPTAGEPPDADTDANRMAGPSPTARPEPPAAGASDPGPGRIAGSGDVHGDVPAAPEQSDEGGAVMDEPERPAGGDRGGAAAAPTRAEPSADAEPAVTIEPALLAGSVRITAVSAAALLALGALVVGGVLVRRRRREAAEADLTATAAETEALLERRALRRARMVLDEPMDPIVASLGLDEPDPAARRSGRRQARRSGDEDA